MGSFGVVVNKSIDETDDLSACLSQDPILCQLALRSGGTIHPEHMMLLHTCQEASDNVLQVSDDFFIGGDYEYLERALESTYKPFMMVCFGYTAWNPHELEDQIAEGRWIVGPKASRAHLEAPHDKLWETLMALQGHQYSILSKLPKNLKDN
jgi:putative transcriptional regulator